MQVLQAELKSSQQRQAAQQIVHDSAMAVLQADTAALRNRLDDVQANGKAALEQLRSSLRDDMEQHRVEVQEQLQVRASRVYMHLLLRTPLAHTQRVVDNSICGTLFG